MMQDENQKLQSLLSQAESVAILTKEILNAEKTSHELLGDELQVMKNWLAELGGENAKMKGELKEKTLDIMLLEKSLETERRNNNTLQDALHRLKEIENLLEEAKKRENEKDEEVERLHKDNEVYREQIENMEMKLENNCEETERLFRTLKEQVHKNSLLVKEKEDVEIEMKRQYQENLRQKKREAEEQNEREKQIQDNMESVLRQKQSLECLLDCKEKAIISLKKNEGEAQLEVQRLLKDCDMLKEKIQLQEQNRMREEKCLREQLRTQEEALREHDKYMLMMFLHGTAQRNFQLEHIALEHGDDMIEEGKREKCTGGTIGRKGTGSEEDPCEKARETEEKQRKKYWNAQREKNEDYEKQWEGLKHIVEDVLHGDE
ncbi:histone-lysine N-methyltransferase, H3 lysine-79 specific-like [Macrobrachium nipponense]|uniref:histone-lysine N-methyltransferase, H3 lysine-79 specific-like n=1 Tax=Macrobrachium nipponense TaxID=159736 RepID=UPI0030C85816